VLRRILQLHRECLGSHRIIERLELEGLKPKHGDRRQLKVIIDICGPSRD
jgi:hypothetical protein